MQFDFKLQHDAMDCGPACLQMVARHYGKRYDLQKLRELCFGNRNGVTMLGISDAAESLGFRSMGVRINIEKLVDNVIFPCIIHWRQSHFVVVYKVKTRCYNGKYTGKIYVADPSFGLVTYTGLVQICNLHLFAADL